ncbi:MAG: hypothetical protein OIN84_11885 [Candidatus Methanoperedens sp.]|nr:hypothetical protein [Candidatus Methanoperedens sp.]
MYTAEISSSNIADHLKTEYSMLRQELQNLKNCQITFLTYAVTATGVLLGLAVNLQKADTQGNPPMLGAFYLIPLTILLPFWWVFFDKATSITRIVGYFRLIETAILDHEFRPKFIGWENSLTEFRKWFGKTGEKPESPQDGTRVFFLLTPHRYWILTFYTFGGLSLLCLLISYYTTSGFDFYGTVATVGIFMIFLFAGTKHGQSAQVAIIVCALLGVAIIVSFISTAANDLSIMLVVLSSALIGASFGRNGRVVWLLTNGYFSYEANYLRWGRILGTIPQSES